MSAQWVRLGAVTDIPRRGARCVKTPLGRIAVFRTADDRIFAMEDRCPHKSGPLSQGIVHGTSVTCPLHNMAISLPTGQAEGADEGKVRTFRIRIVENDIFINAEDLAAAIHVVRAA